MKKNRYLILIAVLLSVVGTMIVLPQRLRNEANWKDVAVVCDWQDIETVSIRTGLPWEQILDEIKKVGVSTIGVSDYDLKNLQQLGKVVPAPIPHGFSPTLRYFAVSDPTLRKTMQNQLILFGKIFQETGNSIFGTNVSYEEEDRIGLGWNMDLINSCYEKGFRIILRPRNWQGITPEVLRGLLADPVYEKAKGLVFFGDQILGNGNAATLAEMASFLKTRNLFWGYTEFVGQKGETTLANLVPEQTVRIHSVPPDELKNYTPAEAKERFIRAVKERSIRLLYVRFFTEPSYDLWGKNITYLRSIIQDLNESGYSWGTVSPLKPFSPPFSVLILFALSVACASAVLYDFFLPGKWVILILVALLEIGSFFTGRLTGMKVMGVLAGMIFPTLALFILIEGFQKKGKEIMVLFSALAMATAGGLVVSQGLYHWLYALRIEQYSGVKTSLIVPLVLVVLYLFKSGLLVGSSIQGVVLGGMKRYEFVILMVLAGGFVLYLTRSGNFPLLPAGLMESKMRLVLERALFMRPRTKEFLIGYPALWLLFTFCRTRLRPIYQLVLWLGVSVGFITFFNSFCHIHTPFLYILLRFGNAILLSVPIFVLYYLVIRIGLLVWNWMAYWGGSE